MLAENNVAGLLAAQAAPGGRHILVDVLIAHRSLLVADALPLKCLIEAEVGHHRGHHRIVKEASLLLHILAADVDPRFTSILGLAVNPVPPLAIGSVPDVILEAEWLCEDAALPANASVIAS